MLGYAMATQQAAVLESIRRLRPQAQKAGSLKTTEQQRVVVQEDNVVIQPAYSETVYVPVYNPTEVYGEWPYPSYPPVYIPPAPAYYPPGCALGAGPAFAAGVAVIGGLWGWVRPVWSSVTVNINVGRYNNINVNRPPIRSGAWRPPAGGVEGRADRHPIRPGASGCRWCRRCDASPRLPSFPPLCWRRPPSAEIADRGISARVSCLSAPPAARRRGHPRR